MARDYLQHFENFLLLGVLGLAAYLGIKYIGANSSISDDQKTADPCAGMTGLPALLCGLGVWTTGYQEKEDRVPTTFDDHGCATAYQEFCQTLNSCIPKGLTCPTGARPYTPVYELDEHGCKKGLETHCDVLQKCLMNEVYEDSFCNIADGRGQAPVRQLNDQCFYKGLPVLNVPPGTDCQSAMAVMCDRFGPGVHAGKDWCFMAGE